jgi:hypothetical protein
MEGHLLIPQCEIISPIDRILLTTIAGLALAKRRAGSLPFLHVDRKARAGRRSRSKGGRLTA